MFTMNNKLILHCDLPHRQLKIHIIRKVPTFQCDLPHRQLKIKTIVLMFMLTDICRTGRDQTSSKF